MAHQRKTDLFDLCQLWRAGFKYAVVLALNAQLAACIPILAHPATESNVIDAEFTLEDYRFMTLSSEDTPSPLAKHLGREIEKILIGAENFDRAEFWKAVFSEGRGKITFHELLEPKLLARVEPLGLDYLVTIASEPESRKDYGTIVFSRSTLRSRYDIGIIDLRHRGPTKTLYAEAYGKGTVLALPFFAFGRDYPGSNDLDGEWCMSWHRESLLKSRHQQREVACASFC